MLHAETLGPEEICGVTHTFLTPSLSRWDNNGRICALTQPNPAGSQLLREGRGTYRTP